ncbi:MATE family efflux transporter [Aquimarina sp. AD1]|uniref:MATE family efflux transporter n=1 Tax=Aquimarina sp. (strain AD1) TaxID=1714848 RepID=UPI000E498FBB|nr:MATE family efflux transporter [Aquimarina sp. AD1]AXT57149.1 MATE family efflux transporter [Aquimarina sp. AD1]RKN37156.1 MATE family efflux transporter [Aquimarina sp. AD1]
MSSVISFKNINRLAIPAIIAGIAEPVLSATDTAIVGNIPINGTESLAAVGIVGSFLSMLIWVLAQTRAAISAIISQYLGAGKLDEVKTLPAQAILFNIGLSITILLATVPFIKEIFILLKAEGLVLDYCISYYSIRVWGFPLSLFVFAIFGIFRGLQNTYWPMIIAIIGVVANIILDFVLVYGIQGFLEPMYLEGAAWASLFSQILMAVLSLVLLLKKTEVSLRLEKLWHPEMKRFLVMSGNLFIRSLALNTTLLLAVREATSLGTNYIAAHSIAIQLWLFFAFFIDGYGGAGNILGGRLLGAKDYTNLVSMAKKVNIYGVIVACILGGISLLIPERLGLIFTKDPEVLNVFTGFFYLVVIALPINALAFVGDGIFKGLGETGFLRNVLVGSTFFGFIPMLFIARYFDWKLYGIWIAISVWMLFRGVALVIKFRNKYYPLANV